METKLDKRTPQFLIIGIAALLQCLMSLSALGQNLSLKNATGNGGLFDGTSITHPELSFNSKTITNTTRTPIAGYDEVYVSFALKPTPSKYRYNGKVYTSGMLTGKCVCDFGLRMEMKMTATVNIEGKSYTETVDRATIGGVLATRVTIKLPSVVKSSSNISIVSITVEALPSPNAEEVIRRYEKCLQNEKEQKEAAEKEKQEQKEAEKREAKAKAQQHSSSNNYNNSSTSGSSYSSTNSNRSSGQTQRNPYDDFRNGMNKMNNSINKIDQAQQKFHNQMDQWREQYRAQSDAEDAKWEREKLQKQLKEERVEQERLEEENRKREEENRKKAAEADYNRRYSAELSRKREIIKARKLLFEGDEWKLSPTFSLIAKNQEPLYLFFVEVDDDYYKLSDNSGFSAYNIQITINENPKMKISPLIEIKPRSNGEYLLSEEIITKIKKEFSLTAGGKIYEFHNWAKNKNECEANYSSFIERAKATDFTLNFIEYTPKKEGNSEYWDKTTQKPSTQQKTQTHTKDYWNSGSAPQKKQKTSNEDYWK